VGIKAVTRRGERGSIRTHKGHIRTYKGHIREKPVGIKAVARRGEREAVPGKLVQVLAVRPRPVERHQPAGIVRDI